jgi:hypothetical protein
MKKYVETFLEALLRASGWHRLDLVGSSAISKISILMPAAGYMIILNKNMIEYSDISPLFKFAQTASPWRLISIYYGSIFLGIGSIIFSWKRSEFSRYHSGSDYYNAFKEYYRDADTLIMMQELLRESHRHQIIVKSHEWFPHYRWFDAADDSGGLNEQAILTAHWIYEMNRRPLARLSCLVFFAIATVLFAIPAMVTLVGVMSYTFHLL